MAKKTPAKKTGQKRASTRRSKPAGPVRAKFRCYEKDGNDVKLEAVVDGSAENKSFFESTPHGTIKMMVKSGSALDRFEVGSEFYVDFTPAK